MFNGLITWLRFDLFLILQGTWVIWIVCLDVSYGDLLSRTITSKTLAFMCLICYINPLLTKYELVSFYVLLPLSSINKKSNHMNWNHNWWIFDEEHPCTPFHYCFHPFTWLITCFDELSFCLIATQIPTWFSRFDKLTQVRFC